jgi:hypothetical protein
MLIALNDAIAAALQMLDDGRLHAPGVVKKTLPRPPKATVRVSNAMSGSGGSELNDFRGLPWLTFNFGSTVL